MAELNDGTLSFEARLSLVSNDVKIVQRQLEDIGKSGTAAGSMIDKALTNAMQNVISAMGSSTDVLAGKFDSLIGVAQESSTAIQQQLNNIQNKLNDTLNAKAHVGGFREVEQAVEDTGKAVDNSLSPAIERATQAMKGMVAGFTVQQLITQIGKTRGEFQQLEVAFETMLGSEERSSKLMNELVNTAAHTPFDLKGIADGAKQLLAYGFAAEEVNDTLVMLGNIASGLSIPLNDIVYLYGTTMTQGRLFTQDLRQFMGRGIPLAEQLADQFGVAKEKVGELVTAGEVGFENVARAMQKMTSEGGQFYNLMDKQSKTINGLVSNLGDAIDTMLNDIGKQTEGVFNDVLKLGISTVENYEKVGKAIAELVAAFGIYKGIMLTVNTLQRINNKITQEAALIQELNAAAGYKMGNAEAIAAAKTSLLTAAQTKLKAALQSTLLANPYALLAAGATALGFAIYKAVTYQTQLEKVHNDIKKASEQAIGSAEAEIAKLNELKGTLSECEEGSEDYMSVKQQIIDQFGQYDSTLTDENTSIETLTEKYEDLTAAIQKSFAVRGFNEAYEQGMKELTEDYSEDLEKLKEKLVSAFGEETGAKIHQSLVNSIRKGDASAEITTWGDKLTVQVKGVSDEINKLLGGEFASLTGKKLFGFDAGNFRDLINNLVQTSNAMKTLRKETLETFALTEQDITPATKKKENKNEETVNEVTDEQKAAAQKRADEIKRLNKEVKDATVRAEFELAQAQIDAMEDGEIKTERQLDLNLQKRLQVIKEQEQAWKQANEKLYKSAELTPEQQKALASMYATAYLERDNDEAKAKEKTAADEQKKLNDRLNKWKEFEEKQTKILQEYAEKRKQIEEDETLDQSTQKNMLSELDLSQQNETNLLLSKLGLDNDEVAEELVKTIETAYDLATNTAVSSLLSELTDVQNQLNALTEDGVTADEEEQVRALQARIVGLEAAVDKAKKAFAKTSDQSDKAGNKITSRMNSAARAMNTLNQAIGDVRNEFGELFGDVTNDALDMVQTLLSTGLEMLGVIKAAGVGTAEGIKEAERGSVILAIVQAAIQVTMAMIKVLMNFTKNAQIQKQIDALALDVERLENAYEKAVFAHRKLVGGEKFRQSIRDVQDLKKAVKDVEQEIKLTQQQIDNAITSRGKKKYEENLLALEEKQRQMIEKIESVYDTFYNAVIGTDSEQFASSLADALIEGFDAGMSELDSIFEDALNDMLKTLVKSQLQLQLTELYDPIFKRFKEQFNDGRTKVTQNDIDAFVRDVDNVKAAGEQIAENWKELYNALGLNTGDLAASANALQGMTQDTAEELNGRFTALQMSGASIDLKMDRLQASLQQIGSVNSGLLDSVALAVGLASDQLSVLEEIRNHTRKLNDIENHLGRVASQMSAITGAE